MVTVVSVARCRRQKADGDRSDEGCSRVCRETSGIRRRVYGGYLIVHRLGPERAKVLRVLNGTQDDEAILFSSD